VTPEQTEEAKALLRSAIRAARVRDTVLFNKKLAEAAAITGAGEILEPELKMLATEAQAAAMQYQHENVVADYAMMLLRYQQPQKARDFLLWCRPVGLENSVHLNAIQERIELGLEHCHDWELYKERYGVPIYYSTFDISQGTWRGQCALATFKELPTDRPVKVLAIGPNDGALERRLLESNPNVTLHLAELATSFEDVLAMLVEEYPGRVVRHEMQHWYDFASEGEEFDLILMVEVLEHLPRAAEAVDALAKHLRSDGVLMLSVPVGKKYHEEAPANAQWYQHVRAYTADTLRRDLTQGFSSVEVVEGHDRTFVAECKAPRKRG
jgi:2-polyprenyl-3-methyl-5-hydroxy-6-metoxy-1,4-benzoquinol methylase